RSRREWATRGRPTGLGAVGAESERGTRNHTATARTAAARKAGRQPNRTTTAGTASPASRVEDGIPACLMPNTVALRAGLVCSARAWLAAGLALPYMTAAAISRSPRAHTLRARGAMRAVTTA